jgi:hypothetical protein
MNEVGEFIFSKFGPWFGDRVFPDYAPKGTADPCMIYQVIGEDFEEMLDANYDDILTIQFRIYATQETGGRATASGYRRRLKRDLDGICRLKISDTDVSKVSISGSFVDGFVDDHDNETGTFAAICIWEVSTEALRAAFLAAETGELLTDEAGQPILTELLP